MSGVYLQYTLPPRLLSVAQKVVPGPQSAPNSALLGDPTYLTPNRKETIYATLEW